MGKTTINETLVLYRDLKRQIIELEDELEKHRKAIAAHVIETGEILEAPGVSTKFRKGYTRASWDGKKLEGYAAAHPEIMAFRSETKIGPSVVITVKKE